MITSIEAELLSTGRMRDRAEQRLTLALAGYRFGTGGAHGPEHGRGACIESMLPQP